LEKVKKYADIDVFVDKHVDDIANTLSELVKRNSVNLGEPNTADESEIQKYLAEILTGMGLEVICEAAESPKRPNVTGILPGNGKGRDLIFNGHADTVPPGDLAQWTVDPFGGEIFDERVWGRGATDCKSGLTCALWAIKAVQAAGVPLRGNVHYISSVGEESNEGERIGVGKALRSDYNDPFCIVTEGTSFEIFPVSCGIFFFTLKVKGKPIHVGRRNLMMYPQNSSIQCGPDVGVDPLEKSLPFIDMFYRMEREWNFRFRDLVLGGGGYPVVDKVGVGLFSICPVDIRGGMYLGSVMDAVTIKYCVSYPEFADREKIMMEIKDAVAAQSATDHWLKQNPPELVIPVSQEWRGFQTDYNHPGIKVLQECGEDVKKAPVVISGHRAVSDASPISQHKIPVVLFGGTNNSDNRIHGFNENAQISDLVDTVKTYARMIVEWCG
jgi:acetylornithine deacetylase